MLENLGGTGWLVVARATHFGACLLLFGIFAFDRIVVHRLLGSDDSISRNHWERIARWLMVITVPGALLSGAFWFVALAMNLDSSAGSGRSIIDVMQIIWTQFHFGRVWRIRFIFWIFASIATILAGWGARQSKIANVLAWIALLLTGVLALSLAWAGHGETGRAPTAHLIADILHLLAAGLWPIGLVPFLLLVMKLRIAPAEQRWPLIAAITSRFSMMSLIAVCLLTATGIVNGWCLIDRMDDLISTAYGRVLLVKVFLFGVMVGIGAINLLVLKPRLARIPQAADNQGERVTVQLQRHVLIEVILGSIVMIVVACLGLLPPSLN